MSPLISCVRMFPQAAQLRPLWWVIGHISVNSYANAS